MFQNRVFYPLLAGFPEKGVILAVLSLVFYPFLAGFLEKGVIPVYRFFSGAIFMTFLSYVSRPFVSSSTSESWV